MQAPYQILGFEKNATPEQIKKAFRDKAKQHHSDKGGNDAIMAELNNAYEVLKDPARRKRYDETGETGAVPTFEKMFEGFINEAFLGIIESTPDVDHTDMLGELKKFTDGLIKSEEQRQKQIRSRCDRFQKVYKRLTVKNEHENQIGKILCQQIDIHKHNLKQIDDSIDFIKQCKIQLEYYDYQTEPKPEGSKNQPTFIIRGFGGDSPFSTGFDKEFDNFFKQFNR